MISLHFWIPGTPKPAGSKSAFCLKKAGRYTGRAVVVDSSGKGGKEWRAAVADHATEEMRRQSLSVLEGPLSMGLTFHMGRPKSHYNKGGVKDTAPAYHTIRPDCTKLVRAVEDAMAGIVYANDSQIVSQQASKIYSGESGCWVTIREIDAPPDNT